MKYKPEDIFTPQGLLADVEKDPNLDFLMNISNIPRAFGVSGFGESWNVGKHSLAAAFIALYWSKYQEYSTVKANQLVVEALTHDLHEAVTGDILPMFKSKTVKDRLEEIQHNILSSLHIRHDHSLEVDLKIIDLVAFLYEIHQVSPSIMNKKKLDLATMIQEKQREILFAYCQEKNVKRSDVETFLQSLGV